MNRHLFAIAALAVVAGPAAAQSSVTLYGLIGIEVGKNTGVANKVVQNGANSRLGVRGVEDLGGGMSAFFNLENRYEPDTGTQSDALRFWNGRSIVGVQGGFGRVWFGREYTPLFLNVALVGDPWGFTGIGQLGSGLAGIGTSRYDNTLNYQISAGGVTAWIQTAEADNNGNSAGTATASKRPMSLALTYAAGPAFVGFGYDTRVNSNDSLWTLVSTYDLGPVKLYGTYANGKTATSAKHREIALAATVPLGNGQLRLGVDQLKRTSAPAVTVKQKMTVGYHYSLSKRTTIFGDITRDGKAATSKGGYGLGVKHAF